MGMTRRGLRLQLIKFTHLSEILPTEKHSKFKTLGRGAPTRDSSLTRSTNVSRNMKSSMSGKSTRPRQKSPSLTEKIESSFTPDFTSSQLPRSHQSSKTFLYYSFNNMSLIVY